MRLTEHQFAEMLRKKGQRVKGPLKFGNVKTGDFASRREAKRYAELFLLQRAGQITDLERQVSFELIPKQVDQDGKLIERAVHYIADFVYKKHMRTTTVVEDAKGHRTRDYVIKRKLMLFRHGIRIVEV